MLMCDNYKISSEELELLEAVRKEAKQARSMPKIDVFKACELVQLDIELLTPELLTFLFAHCPKLLAANSLSSNWYYGAIMG